MRKPSSESGDHRKPTHTDRLLDHTPYNPTSQKAATVRTKHLNIFFSDNGLGSPLSSQKLAVLAFSMSHGLRWKIQSSALKKSFLSSLYRLQIIERFSGRRF